MSLTMQAPPPAAPGFDDDGPIRRAGSSRRSRFTRHVVLCLIGAVMMYPLLWLISSSLKPNSIIFKDLSLWPAQWDPGNYASGWTALEHPFSLYLVNSFVIVVLSIIGNLFSCSLAAYGFARLKFTGRKLFFALMLGTMMLPGHVLLVPQYIVFAKLDWINTYYPLLVPNFLATNAFYIFLMVQFMRALPIELDDAARIDGAGPFRIFWSVIMPLSLPAFATTDRLLRQERPDVVVVTSPDATHAGYVSAALRSGVDVVVEKPMTTDVAGLRQIRDALEAGTGRLTVTFNYRYSPRNSEVRRLIAAGAIGEVTSVHFEWCLDTVHGADYFRRWHRDKATSGGLLVHKSTHHFDLVNWWLDDTPSVVFALGGLRFYGADNARRRGLPPRPERSRDAVPGDPFALDISTDDLLREMYRDGEHLDGYIRDRDVFSDGISIEDNLNVVVGYHGGASMSYSLHAHSPWEGYRVAINGTAGRIELDVVERAQVTPPNGSSAGPSVLDPSAVEDHRGGPAQLRPRGSRLLLQPHWKAARQIPIPAGAGSHGGGDGMLLDDVFRGPADDPLHRQAGFTDGAASVLVGVAGNESLRTGRAVRLDEFGLSLSRSTPAAASGRA